MAYPKTKLLAADLGIDDPQELRDLILTYADELEENEPYATNSIREARNTADGIADALED